VSDWLRPVRDALDARSTPVDTFVRDDDGGWADDRLTAMLDVFERRRVPIDVAVIPDALGRTLADQLLERHARGGLHLHQHGRSHTNHEPADHRKCEFGAARGVEAIHRDVAEGHQRLRELLGDAAEPVFTPPWNRSVDELGAAVVAAGHRVLSRDRSAGSIGHPGLIEIPVTVDWFGSTKGERWSRVELGRRLAAELAGDDPVGIMLHHGVTGDDELAEIEALVTLLASHDAAAPSSILTLAGDRAVTGS
jgi:peptidoglycan/xylan/chitin deacetylase (PgdA/CDA1 family)